MLDVAVIGGGISGMTAAYSLGRRGYRVIVLERQAAAPSGLILLRPDGPVLLRR